VSNNKIVIFQKLSHLFAQGWQRVGVLDGLGREDGDLVAVDLDGALS